MRPCTLSPGLPAKYLSCSAMARRALVWCLGLAAMHCLKVASRDEMVTELPMSSPSSVTCHSAGWHHSWQAQKRPGIRCWQASNREHCLQLL